MGHKGSGLGGLKQGAFHSFKKPEIFHQSFILMTPLVIENTAGIKNTRRGSMKLNSKENSGSAICGSEITLRRFVFSTIHQTHLISSNFYSQKPKLGPWRALKVGY